MLQTNVPEAMMTEAQLPPNTDIFDTLLSLFQCKERSPDTSIADAINSGVIWTPSDALGFTTDYGVDIGNGGSAIVATTGGSGIPSIASGFFLMAGVMTFEDNVATGGLSMCSYGDMLNSVNPYLGIYNPGGGSTNMIATSGAATATIATGGINTTPRGFAIAGEIGASKTLTVAIDGAAPVESAPATIDALNWDAASNFFLQRTTLSLCFLMAPTRRPHNLFLRALADWLKYNVITGGNKTLYPLLKGR
jgi:hypothetical protein